MKKITFTVCSLFILIVTGFSQQKVNGKAVISTPGVLCDFCKRKIENNLSHEYGIISATVNLKKGTTTVQWISDRTNIEEIKAEIAMLGFDADDVTAEESAYKKLPKACQTKPAKE